MGGGGGGVKGWKGEGVLRFLPQRMEHRTQQFSELFEGSAPWGIKWGELRIDFPQLGFRSGSGDVGGG